MHVKHITVKFLELAQSEVDDAFEAYEYQKKYQGYAFVQDVKETLTLIKTYPSIWSKSSSQTQRCLLKNFPYGIIYQKKDDILYVVAFMNLRKKPIHWVSKSVSEYSTCRISSLPETMYTR
jgi:hypothetical protein